MMIPVTITVNGKAWSQEVEPRLLLVHFLRDIAGLTGTKSAATRASAALARCCSMVSP